MASAALRRSPAMTTNRDLCPSFASRSAGDTSPRRQARSRLCKSSWTALGSAESLYGMEDRFETIVLGKTIIYRKPIRGG